MTLQLEEIPTTWADLTGGITGGYRDGVSFNVSNAEWWRAFDGNPYSYWRSNSHMNGKTFDIRWEYHTAQELERVQFIQSAGDNAPYAKLFSSDDGSSWTQRMFTAVPATGITWNFTAVTAKYWKIEEATQDVDYWAIYQIKCWGMRDWVQPSLESVEVDLDGIGATVSYDGGTNPTYPTTNMLNGSEANRWRSAINFAAANSTLKISLPQELTIDRIKLRQLSANEYPESLIIETSVDGIAWGVAAVAPPSGLASHAATYDVSFPPVTARYWRLREWDYGADYWSIHTFQMWQHPAAAAKDWLDVSIKVELETETTLEGEGAIWDTSLWDAGLWAGTERTWLDVTADYVSANITASTRSMFGTQFAPSSALITLKNGTGEYSPSGDATIVRVGQGLRVTATLEEAEGGVALEVRRFTGVVSGVNDADVPGQVPHVRIRCTDRLAVLARQNRTKRDLVGHDEHSGKRLERILDGAGVDATMRDIDTGVERMQATELGGSPLAEARVVADSDGGRLYTSTEGLVTFEDRTAADGKAGASASVTLAGHDRGTVVTPWVAWAKYVPRHAIEDVANTVTVGRKGGTPKVQIDAVSQQQYGKATAVRTDLMNRDDTWPATYAARILAARKDVIERVESVQLSNGDPDGTKAVLELTQGDVIALSRMIGGTQYEGEAQIRGWSESFKPARKGTATVARSDTWLITMQTEQATELASVEEE